MISTRILSLLSLLSASLLPPSALADTITGRVVDPGGVGVPNVNIDGQDLVNGGDADIANDGTDANGFFNAQLDAGLYQLFFKPPAPPSTTLVAATLDEVNVSGTVNLGTIVLEQGVSLAGRAVNSSNQGVPNVDLNVERKTNGEAIALANDNTNATGNFLIAVPTGPIDLLFDTSNVGGSLLAPSIRTLNLTANHNMGNVQLPPGFLVTAIVRRTNGTGVQGADVDAEDSATGDKQYTPHDNTDNNGFVDFVLRAGTFDIEFCAPTVNRLVTKVLPGVVVNSAENLGVVTMQSGVLLSGHVQSQQGASLAKVDLDLSLSSDGTEVATCHDDTDANGNYSVVAPTGTFDVEFEPLYIDPYGTRTFTSVVINADKTQNATLPPCDGVVEFGSGTAGTGGRVPQLSASGGYLRIGNPFWTANVTQGRGGATAFLYVSAGPNCGSAGGAAYTPLRQLGSPTVFVLSGASGAAGAGNGSVTWPLPNNTALVGLEIHARVFVTDPQAVGGFAATAALCGTFCD